jgi:hypothetical protein
MPESDEDSEATAAAWQAQFRELIGRSVQRVIGQYATQIDLRDTSKQRQLENDAIETLLHCVVIYVDAPGGRRPSQIRREFERIGKEAAAAEEHLNRLRDALDDLPSPYGQLLSDSLESVAKIDISLVTKQVPWSHALSSVADTANVIARGLRGTDQGGAPKKVVFRTLVNGLMRAFERATGRSAKVTFNPVKSQYEGDFVHLVEALLPVVLLFEIAKQPMPIPKTAFARGKYIDRMTQGKGPKKKA